MTDSNGLPALSTPTANELLQATLQHVVVTFNPVDGRRIYVNGQDSSALDAQGSTGLADWNSSFALMLGDEVSGNHPWLGTIRLLAIHNRALTQAQIAANYGAGVGQKFFLLFALSAAGLVDASAMYIKFTVAQFDNYSYLFTDPQLISLDSSVNVAVTSVSLEGLRIGINGREATTGQAYARLQGDFAAALADATGTLPAPAMQAAGGYLASVGTLIAQEKGPALDEFFLTFEGIGSRRFDPSVAPLPSPVPAADLAPQASIGVRHFAEINASLAQLTGIDGATLRTTFTGLMQQLPVSENIRVFSTAQQMAVAQLTVAYCQALTSDVSRRASFFSGVDFNQPATVALGVDNRDLVTAPLIARLVVNTDAQGGQLATQPDAGAIKVLLDLLLDDLLANGTADTQAMVMATCAASFGHAGMLVQ